VILNSSIFSLLPDSPCFLTWLIFDPEDRGDMFLRNVNLLNKLHGVISSKIELFTFVISLNERFLPLKYSVKVLMDTHYIAMDVQRCILQKNMVIAIFVLIFLY
jgi:hypothetical protein